MNNTELGRLVKQKYPEYANYSDEEIGSKMMIKYPQYASAGGAKPYNPLSSDKSLLESVAPTAGSIAGGFAGPIGTGAGYSIGTAASKIKEQMRTGGEDVLANIFGKSQGVKMTPYGQQKTQELGMTGSAGANATPDLLKSLMQSGQKLSTQPEFSYGKEAVTNLKDPENQKAANKWEKQALGGAAISGLSDFGMKAVTNVITTKLLPKINPKLGVSGIKPSTVRASAQEAADEVWKPIQETLETSTKAGKGVDVTQAVNKLNQKIIDIENTFGAGKIPASAADDIAGYQKVLDELISSTTVKEGSYILNPKAAQKITSYFGKSTFSPTTKLGKVSSDIENSAEITAKQMVSPEIKKELFKVLDGSGLKDSAKMFKDYGTLVNLKDEMLRPINKIFEASAAGSTIGAAGTMLGAPGIGIPVGFAAFMSLTPIGRQIMRELVKAPIKAAPPVARATVPTLLERFMNGGR